MSTRRSITRRSRPSPQAKVDKTLPVSQFDRATLAEAKKIILGTSDWFRFDEDGKLVNLKPYDDPENLARIEEMQENRQRTEINFSPKKLNMALAALTLVANHEARHGQNDSMQLRAFSYRLDAKNSARLSLFDERFGGSGNSGMGSELREKLRRLERMSPAERRAYNESNPETNFARELELYKRVLGEAPSKKLSRKDEEDVHRMSSICEEGQTQSMSYIEKKLGEINQIAHGQVTPEDHFEESHDPYHDYLYAEEKQILDLPDPMVRRQAYVTKMIKELLKSSGDVRREAEHLNDDDLFKRLHNSHPEAVRFVLSSREAECLLGFNSSQDIKDVRSFLGSPWAQMAANIEFQVAPEVLKSLHAELRGQSVGQA